MIRKSCGAVYTQKNATPCRSLATLSGASVETFCPEDAFSFGSYPHRSGVGGGKRTLRVAWERKVLWLQAVCRIRRRRPRDMLVWQGVRGCSETFEPGGSFVRLFD